jgi:hypothetical protein
VQAMFGTMPASIEYVRACKLRPLAVTSARRYRNVWTTDMDLERLVDELWCGNHGLGDVSRFLLRTLRNDESAAKAEFSKFLQGKLSDGLLKLSRRAVGKDGRPHRHGRSLGARGRTMNGSKQSATGDTSWPAEGAIGP